MDEFITDLGTGMRRVTMAERHEFDGPTAEALTERLREFDRCRERGEHDLRTIINVRSTDV